MSSNKVLLEKREGGVSLLMFNNPERRNAIDMEVREEMGRLLDELDRDADTRVIVLTGKGEHFSAGGDVKDWKDFTVLEARERLKRIHVPLRKMLQMEKPFVAMVRGYAVGAGMNFTLACDVVFASEDARFSQSFVRMGLIPDAGGLCLLPVAVGLHRAKELMFTGEMIDAKRAHALGVVNRLVPKEALEQETLAFARKLAKGPPVALGLTKRILNTLFLDGLEKVLEYEAQAQPLLFQTQDHKEGKTAFLDKREPGFTGK